MVQITPVRAALVEGTTERLLLCRPCLADAVPLFEATRHPEFNRFLLWKAPGRIEEMEQRVSLVLAQDARNELCAVAARERMNSRFVALLRLTPMAQLGSLEMGYWTHPDFWGGGYTSELVRRCVHTAMSCPGVQRIVAMAADENLASCALLERSGFVRKHVTPRDTEHGGIVDLRVFEHTR